jgi:hypothetical protein
MELGRREGFLSHSAQKVARTIRLSHALPARNPTSIMRVRADLEQRRITLSGFETSRSNSRLQVAGSATRGGQAEVDAVGEDRRVGADVEQEAMLLLPQEDHEEVVQTWSTLGDQELLRDVEELISSGKELIDALGCESPWACHPTSPSSPSLNFCLVLLFPHLDGALCMRTHLDGALSILASSSVVLGTGLRLSRAFATPSAQDRVLLLMACVRLLQIAFSGFRAL